MGALKELFFDLINPDDIETPEEIIEKSNIATLKEPINAEYIYNKAVKVRTKSGLSNIKPVYSKTLKERQNNIETNRIKEDSDPERE